MSSEVSKKVEPEETEPRISVTLNVPVSVYNEIEAYTRAKWPDAKRAPRWIALLRTGFELTKEIDAKAAPPPERCGSCGLRTCECLDAP